MKRALLWPLSVVVLVGVAFLASICLQMASSSFVVKVPVVHKEMNLTSPTSKAIVSNPSSTPCPIPDLPPISSSTGWYEPTSTWSVLTEKELGFRMLYPNFCGKVSEIYNTYSHDPSTVSSTEPDKSGNDIYLYLDFSTSVYLEADTSPFSSDGFIEGMINKKVVIDHKHGVRSEGIAYGGDLDEETKTKRFLTVSYTFPNYKKRLGKNLSFVLGLSVPEETGEAAYYPSDVAILEQMIKTVRFTN